MARLVRSYGTVTALVTRDVEVGLTEIEAAMREDDLMMITADHGNDPTFRGSDHTREYAPLLVFGKSARPGVNLGTRSSLSDIGRTIASNFNLRISAGESFLTEIS